MSTASEEIRTALAAAETLPVGPERIAALDTVLSSVSRAGGAHEVGRLGTRIRSALLTACLTGGQHGRVPELLGWLTARYDEAPAWMDEQLRRQVLANLAEAAAGLLAYPDVSRSLINHITTGAEQRYADAGEPAGPVLRARFLFIRHVQGIQAASSALETWLEAGPSPVGIGCPDCERAEQVRGLVELGSYQRAIEHAGPVLRAPGSGCAAQPAGMIGAVMPALLRSGLVGAAAAEHVRAVRLIQAQLAAATVAAAVSTSGAASRLASGSSFFKAPSAPGGAGVSGPDGSSNALPGTGSQPTTGDIHTGSHPAAGPQTAGSQPGSSGHLSATGPQPHTGLPPASDPHPTTGSLPGRGSPSATGSHPASGPGSPSAHGSRPATDSFPTAGSLPTTGSQPATGSSPVPGAYPATGPHSATGSSPATGPIPTTGPGRTTGPAPAPDFDSTTGPHPATGPIPTAESGTTTGPAPARGSLPTTGPIPTTGSLPATGAHPSTGPIPTTEPGSTTGSARARGSLPATGPTTGYLPATGSQPASGSHPATGPIPTTEPGSTTGPAPVHGSLPTTGPIPTTGSHSATGPIPTTGPGSATGPVPAHGSLPTTGPIPTTGSFPTSGSRPATGSHPASGSHPATGPIPTTGSSPATGSFPATGALPVTGALNITGTTAADLAAGDLRAATALHDTGAADQLLVCARTGRLRHGLDLLREWLPALSRIREPLERLETAAAISRLVWSLTEAGRATEVVLPAARASTLPVGLAVSTDLTVSLLGERVLAESSRLAKIFDRRNETTTVGDRLRETLGSGSLPDLPLEAFERAGLPEWAPAPSRGRRADQDGEPADVTLLAKEFEDGLRADSAEAMQAVLTAWGAQRTATDPNPGGDPDVVRAAARLDGWLALDQISTRPVDPGLQPPPEALARLEAANAATRRMRAAGLVLESLLHDQACVLAAAQSRLMEPGPAMDRIEELTAEVAGVGSGPDLGEALSRLVLAREIAAHAGVPVPAQISELVPMHGAVPEAATALLSVDPPVDEDEVLAALEAQAEDELEVQPIHDPSVAEAFGPASMPTSLLGPFITTPIRVTPSESPGHRPFPEDDDTGRPRRRLDAIEKLRAQMSPEEIQELAHTLDLVNFDPLETAVAQLRSVPPERLEHRHLRALTRMLRLRARDEPRPTAISTLMQAIATLPEGVRPLERAQAGADLATVLAETDPGAALAVWQHAVEDAERSGDGPVLGTLLAASAMLRHRTGEASLAAADLARAVPLLDRFAPAALAGQCRVDLSRVLLELDRPFAAAAAAEAALADVVEGLRADGLETPPVKRENAAPDEVEPIEGEISPEVASRMHLAGAAAFAAAEANSTAGTPGPARRLAIRSAQWHARNGNPIGQAEAWQLAARVAGRPGRVAADLLRAAELAEAGGDWARAATCRRERVTAVRAEAGDEAALDALDEADETLQGWSDSLSGRRVAPEEREKAEHQMRWHRVAVAEQRARLLALAGYFGEAMEVAEPLVEEYQQLGDTWSARDLQGLRGQLRAELGDLEGAVSDLNKAAAAAQAVGEGEQTHGLGARLAAVLGGAGRDDEAEAAWTRFCEPNES